jgi:hypothetical protein
MITWQSAYKHVVRVVTTKIGGDKARTSSAASTTKPLKSRLNSPIFLRKSPNAASSHVKIGSRLFYFFELGSLFERKDNLWGQKTIREDVGQIVIHEVVDRSDSVDKGSYALLWDAPTHSEFKPREVGTLVCQKISAEGDVLKSRN